MSPLIWLVAIMVVFVCYVFMYSPDKSSFGIIILVSIVIYFIYKYEWFSRKDPDRLQTEEFLLAKKELEYMAIQGEQPKLVENTEIVSPIKKIENR